jgi:hypothetical protein
MRWPRLNFFWARFRGSWATASRQSPNDQIEKGRAAPSRSTTFGRAFLRFENGATGAVEANWIATGRKMQHDFEIYGTKGALLFPRSGLELHFYSSADAAGRTGFRRIEAGPDNRPTVGSAWRRAISSGSTISKRSRSRAISTPLPVGARNPSISAWVFAFRPSLRRSKNHRGQRNGWMSKMADKLLRHGDGVSVSLQATKVAEWGRIDERVANCRGRFHNFWLFRQATLHSAGRALHADGMARGQIRE